MKFKKLLLMITACATIVSCIGCQSTPTSSDNLDISMKNSIEQDSHRTSTTELINIVSQEKDKYPAWEIITKELIDTKKAIYVEDVMLSLENSTIELTYWDTHSNTLTKRTSVIKSSHQYDYYGEECLNQYAFTAYDMLTDDEVCVPNLFLGIMNKVTGEFVFSTAEYDSLYHFFESGNYDTIAYNLKFSTGEEAIYCGYNYSVSNKYSEHYEGLGYDWMSYLNIQFSHKTNIDDWVFFMTSCDNETWSNNTEWYKTNYFTVTQDFYGNLDRMYTTGADLQFWKIINNPFAEW